MRLAIVVCRRSWRENFSGSVRDFHKKEKEAKRKNMRKGRPVGNCRSLWKSTKVACGNFFLMISNAA